MIQEQFKKCHNCNGTGYCEGGLRKGQCYYCKGTGTRYPKEADENKIKEEMGIK